MPEEKVVQAVVQKIITDGENGPYAVASNSKHRSITFALTDAVWSENDYPEIGEIVHLTKLRKMQAGWRSYAARRLHLSE